jgi:hypothetical protein
MTFEEFAESFESLMRMALTSGVRNVDRPHVHPKEYSPAEWRRFMTGCHRGYAKAQAYMVPFLEAISSSTLSGAEKRRCTLLVRSVAETIALTLLGDDAYMIRRLPLFDDPPPLDFATLHPALAEANRLNGESRLTFALLADLTLSIQVADIIRMDLRKRGRRYEFIELKSGRVNDALGVALANYPPDEAALPQIDADPAILPQHRKQAKRMLRQRIRVAQVQEVLLTDAGVDIQHKRPIRISPKAVVLKDYDVEVAQILKGAEKDGTASTVIAETIVISASVGREPGLQGIAREGLRRQLGALHHHLLEVAPDISAEVAEALGEAPPYNAFNLFESVLGQVAIRPPTTWAVSSDHVLRLVRRSAYLMSGFHLVGFLRMARGLGIEMRFATRRETARIVSGIGAAEVPRWNGLALVWFSGGQLSAVTAGLLGRFLYCLTEPRSFLSQMTEIANELSATQPAED